RRAFTNQCDNNSPTNRFAEIDYLLGSIPLAFQSIDADWTILVSKEFPKLRYCPGCGALMRVCSSCAALVRYITSDCLSPSTPGTYMYRWCRFQIGPIGGEMRSRILGGVRSFTLNSPEVDNGMTVRNA